MCAMLRRSYCVYISALALLAAQQLHLGCYCNVTAAATEQVLCESVGNQDGANTEGPEAQAHGDHPEPSESRNKVNAGSAVAVCASSCVHDNVDDEGDNAPDQTKHLPHSVDVHELPVSLATTDDAENAEDQRADALAEVDEVGSPGSIPSHGKPWRDEAESRQNVRPDGAVHAKAASLFESQAIGLLAEDVWF